MYIYIYEYIYIYIYIYIFIYLFIIWGGLFVYLFWCCVCVAVKGILHLGTFSSLGLAGHSPKTSSQPAMLSIS